MHLVRRYKLWTKTRSMVNDIQTSDCKILIEEMEHVTKLNNCKDIQKKLFIQPKRKNGQNTSQDYTTSNTTVSKKSHLSRCLQLYNIGSLLEARGVGGGTGLQEDGCDGPSPTTRPRDGLG